MAWIESHQELARHPKIFRLRSALGVHKAQAIGHLHLLWYWVMDYSTAGDLSGFSPEEIAAAAEWDGEPGAFVGALVATGWIDKDMQVHDWSQYAGRLLHIRETAKNRMRMLRERAANVRRTFSERADDPTQPNPTQPNPTQPNPTQPLSGKPDVGDRPDRYHPNARAALHILNEASGKHFREVDANLSIISARLKEPDVDLEGVRAMILRKCSQWKTDPKMMDYIRPSTLFGKEKFDGYYASRNAPVGAANPETNQRNLRIGSEESRAALRAQWAEADKRNGVDQD